MLIFHSPIDYLIYHLCHETLITVEGLVQSICDLILHSTLSIWVNLPVSLTDSAHQS